MADGDWLFAAAAATPGGLEALVNAFVAAIVPES
jgi:hypothetical protein